MIYEKIIVRESGDIVKITTLLSANVFLECGYEQEQFASVKKSGSDEWVYYYHRWFPKSMSREEYMNIHRPTTFWGVVSLAEAILAAQEAKKQFFK